MDETIIFNDNKKIILLHLDANLEKDFGIYAIINMINNKVYIGKTEVNFLTRFLRHQNDLYKDDHFNEHLKRAVVKYGIKNFKFVPIEITTNKEEVLSLEDKWLALFLNEEKNSYNDTICYNINLPGTSGGANTNICKKVYQYSMDKKLVGEYISLAEAERINNIRHEYISASCLGKYYYACGFHWSFTKIDVDQMPDINTLHRKKIVYQYDINGNLIGQYDGVREASRLTNTSNNNISEICSKKHKPEGEYYWSYELLKPGNIPEFFIRTKTVYQYNNKKELVGKHNNISEISRQLGISTGNISACCKGKRKHAGGYFWSYTLLSPEEIPDFNPDNYKKKIVYQYNNKKELITKYESINEASRINNLDLRALSRCCNKMKPFGNFFWSFELLKPEQIPDFNENKLIYQCDKDGNIINIYKTLKEASETTKLTKNGIYNALVKRSKSSGGFIWKYINETEKENK